MKKVEIANIEYYTRANPKGYGYEILSIEKIGKNSNYTVLFHTCNKELVKEIFSKFENGEVVTDFPDTSNEVPPMKLLVYRSKHFTGYYNVPTLESLDKTYRFILKEEYGKCIKNMSPNRGYINDSGVSSQEEIDSIPVEAVRNDIQTKWDKYQSRIKDDTRELQEYENLRLVVEEDKGNANRAMGTYEAESFDIEDIAEIK